MFTIKSPAEALNDNTMFNIASKFERNRHEIPNNYFRHTFMTNHKIVYSVFNNKNQLVGFAILRKGKTILKLALIGTSRKKEGIGKLLIQKIISNAATKFKNVKLLVLEPVPSAIGFYKKLGFNPTTKTSRTYAMNI